MKKQNRRTWTALARVKSKKRNRRCPMCLAGMKNCEGRLCGIAKGDLRPLQDLSQGTGDASQASPPENLTTKAKKNNLTFQEKGKLKKIVDGHGFSQKAAFRLPGADHIYRCLLPNCRAVVNSHSIERASKSHFGGRHPELPGSVQVRVVKGDAVIGRFTAPRPKGANPETPRSETASKPNQDKTMPFERPGDRVENALQETPKHEAPG